MKTKQLKNILLSKKKDAMSKDFVSTGSTILNIACSGNPDNGFMKGHYYFIVGDSASGKTFLSLTCLAEASINEKFNDYRFIYDNSEDGALMDLSKFFGKKVAERIEPPSMDDGLPVFSSTIEDFYFHLDDAVKTGKPFIYVLDSMDSLSSIDEIEKFDETKETVRKGRQATGSYGDGKAKKNSANLRRILAPLKKTGSILIIINQTRDNLGFGFEKKTRSGGHALRFYACIEMWSSIKSKIKKTVEGKPRTIGIECQIQIKKNRLIGKESTITVPIYYSHGIDDVGSCINYLLEENHWKLKANSIVADEFNFKGTFEKLVKFIEKEGKESELRQIVKSVWSNIEESCAIKRKFRYE